MICCLSTFLLYCFFIYCLDCKTAKIEKKPRSIDNKSEKQMEQGDQTSSNVTPSNLDVVSMVIWLSTGNGKFFELVR
jgi:hypothetical protein